MTCFPLRPHIFLMTCLLCCMDVSSYLTQSRPRRMPSSNGHLTSLFAKEADTPSKEIEPLARASWYAVEAFGNIFGAADVEQSRYISLDQPPDSLQETLQRIKGDNHRYYFLSGEVDRLIYDEKCTFCDPFVSFDGRDRFIKNLANLGSFIARYDVKPLGYQVQNPTLVKTKALVKLELKLPWKPILAWPWGVEYTIDEETNLIVKHRETWDIDPVEGIKQIFRRPTLKINDKNSPGS